MATIKHQHPSYGEIEFKVFRPMEVKIDGKSCMSPACRTKRGNALNGALTKAAATVRQGLAETRRPAPTPQTKLFPPEADAPAWLAREATDVARWAAGRWGMPAPQVKWFNPADRPQSFGTFFITDPSSIWLSTALRGEQLKETTLHEVSHYARHHGGHVNTEPEVERDTVHLRHHLHLDSEAKRKWASYEY